MEKKWRRTRRKTGAAAAKTITGYVRVSTDGQSEKGESLPDQEERIRRYAETAGLAVNTIYADVMSGGRADNRAGLQSALTDVCASGGVLVAVSISRFARSTKDMIEIAERLEKAGADLVSLSERIDTTSASGVALFEMLAVFAKWERNVIRERTRDAVNRRREQGRRISRHAPFGWDFGGASGDKLTRNATEQKAIAIMIDLDAKGISDRAIARELEGRNIRTKTGGKRWRHDVVRNVLARATKVAA